MNFILHKSSPIIHSIGVHNLSYFLINKFQEMKKKEMLKTVLKKLEKIEETKQGQLKGGFASIESDAPTTASIFKANNCRPHCFGGNNCQGSNCVSGGCSKN